VAKVELVAKTKIVKLEHLLDTTITFMFKAVCPIPDKPNTYQGQMSVHYVSSVCLDFNAVKETADRICEEGMNSVEDVVEKVRDYVRSVIPTKELKFLEVIAHIPAQVGHLDVVVKIA